MEKYIKEIVIMLLQIFMFYIFPFFAGPTDAIGMVILIIMATFLFSAILGGISGNKIKFLYPVATAIIFIPTIFIHYNESASIHSVWYLVISSVGLLLGIVIRVLLNILKGKIK